MEKIWKRVQKFKGKFFRRAFLLLTNASYHGTRNPSGTSKIFREAFASILVTEYYTYYSQRYKGAQEAKRVKFINTNDETYNT